MRKYLLASLVLMYGLCGCAKSDVDDVGSSRPIGKSVIEVTACDDSTRIYLGDMNDDNSYPVLWHDDDVIAVNGIHSSSITVNADNGSAASFEFDALLDVPYRAIYPASSAIDDCTRVTLPLIQTAAPGTFDRSAAILVGFSETAGSVALKNVMAFMKVTVNASSDNDHLKYIRIEGNDLEPMSGTFDVDYANLTLSPVTDDGLYVKLDCAGTALGNSFLIAIPAATYAAGITMTIVDENGHYQIIERKTPFTAEPGKVYASEVVFEPTGTYVDGGIYTAADFRAFTLAADGGVIVPYDGIVSSSETTDGDYSEWVNGDGEVVLMNDIKIGTVGWTNTESGIADMRVNSIANWKGVFNGNGHTITVESLTTPIFINLFGTVKNLTVEGAADLRTPRALGAAIVAQLQEGGRLYEVDNRIDLEVRDESLSDGATLGGLCARAFGGSIESCTNYGNISYEATDAVNGSAGHVVYAGGLVARVGIASSDQQLSQTVTIKRCANEGNISINSQVLTNYLAAGGFVGRVRGLAPVDANLLEIENCVNNGNVSMNGPSSSSLWTPNLGSGAGGFIGMSAHMTSLSGYAIITFPYGGSDVYGDGYAILLDNCVNNGIVEASVCGANTSTSSNRVRTCVGGMCGVMFGSVAKHAVIRNCKNYGKLVAGFDVGSAGSARSSMYHIIGGLVGYGGCVDMSGCVVKATLGDPSLMRNVFAIGGLFGSMYNLSSVSDCNVFADIYYSGIYVGGFDGVSGGATENWRYASFINGNTSKLLRTDSFSALAGSVLSGCSVGGTINYNTVKTGTTYSGAISVTADNLSDYVCCYDDLNNESFMSSVSVSFLNYWNGIE